jgi:hypothetical protein
VDDQIRKALNRAENTAFGLKSGAGVVLVLMLASLPALADAGVPAICVFMAAGIAAVAALFGFSALVSIQGARLLLAWRQDIGQRPPSS